VPDQERDRRPRGLPLEEAGQHLDPVRLAALGGQPALPRPAAVEVALDVRRVDGDPRRASVDHHPHRRAVRLAESADAEEGAEDVPHDGGDYTIRESTVDSRQSTAPGYNWRPGGFMVRASPIASFALAVCSLLAPIQALAGPGDLIAHFALNVPASQ